MGLIIGVGGSGGSGGGNGVYKFKGSVQTYQDLLSIQSPKNGDTYNVIEQFTLDGKTYLAGTNFAWSESDGAWDALGGTMDFTGYYPEMSVGAADTLIPEASDAVVDNTAFIFQSAGGNASIAESATAKLSDFQGNAQMIDEKIVGVNVSKFYATGLNQFDKSGTSPICQIMTAKKLVANGNNYDIVEDSSYFIAVIKSLACYTGQGNNNGYVVKVCDADFSDTIAVGFSQIQSPSGVFKVTQTTNYNSQSYARKAADNSLLPQGYLFVCVPNTYTGGGETLQTADKLCVHLAWSGYNDPISVYEEFSPSEITIPQIATGSYFSNGNISDECNFDTQKTIQRIGRVLIGDLTWTEEYDENQEQIGWETSDLANSISHDPSSVILNDYAEDPQYNSIGFSVDSNGVVHCATLDNPQDFGSKYMFYELATPVETAIASTGLYNVGDFGTEWFYDTKVAPSACTIKYAANLRDTVRSLANSGVTFGSNGIFNAGLYFGEVKDILVNTDTVLTLDQLERLLIVTLSGNANITLPVDIAQSFSFQMVVKATGAYTLTIAAADGGSVYNLSLGAITGANGKRCYLTLFWDGSNWALSASEWFNN